jgi:serine/threonine protein kinase
MPTTLPTIAELSEGDRQLLQNWLAQFEQFWDVARLQSLARFLPSRGTPLRAVLLVELVKIDLRHQWQRGLRVTVETYLLYYPELGTAETVPAELVLAEFEVRKQSGASVAWDEFRQRFPRQVEELASRGQVHETPTVPPAGLPSTSVWEQVSLTPDRPLAGKFGRYEILEQLGKGGMGTVYLALDTQLKRRVALKVPNSARNPSPILLERFFREARAAAMLVHPNICPVYDVGEWQGVHYLTMAVIEGKPLTAYAKAVEPLPQRWVAEVVYRIALALEEAHAQGIVHRDLKPANVIINQRGEPVVMDFGLARLFHEAGARLTQTGLPLGTPLYMAPEQIQGQDTANSPSCDVYSLGVICYELLTGRVPFRGSMAEVMTQALVQPPAPPSQLRPGVDPRLEAVCLKALAKEVSARHASMREFAQALADYLNVVPSSLSALEVKCVPDAEVKPTPEASMTDPQESLAGLPSTQVHPSLAGECALFAEPECPQTSALADSQPGARSLVVAPAPMLPVVRQPPSARRPWRVPRGVWAGAALVPAVAAALGVLLLLKGAGEPGEAAPPQADPSPVVTPAEAEEAQDSTGTVQVSLPKSAGAVRMQLDGQPLAAKDLARPLKLSEGAHVLRVLQGPYVDALEKRFTVRTGTNPGLEIKPTFYGDIAVVLSDSRADVRVEIDDQQLAKAMWGAEVRLKAGEHRLQVKGKDIDPIDQPFTVRPGPNQDLSVKPTFYGTVPLVLEGKWGEIAARLDGRPLTLDRSPLSLRLTVGPHRLQITGRTIAPIDRTWQVERGMNRALEIKLVGRP